MFQKLKFRLMMFGTCSTTLIVLLIVLCCLRVSEHDMYGQEQALFLLRANTIATDLRTMDEISIHWYTKNMTGQDILWLEIGGAPSSLASVVVNEEKRAMVRRLKTYLETADDLPASEKPSAGVSRRMFAWDGFLVMEAHVSMGAQKAACLYLYSLKELHSRVRHQRVLFFAIWFLSAAALSVFSWLFTAVALRPVVENDERQRQFVSVASHELRSPLAVFKTGLSVLKTEPGEKKAARIFALLEGEMSRMERLIRDLLYLAKAERADFGLRFQEVSLKKLLDAVYEKYALVAEERGISLTCQGQEERFDCVCDPQKIEQVLVILLDNALSYTPAGGSVGLSLFRWRGKYCIQVEDTGCGISPGDKKKIFDRFYQSSTSRSSREHFGLGLSIAGEICKRHGAKIVVADRAGGGSIFTLRLEAKRSRAHGK